MRLTRKRHLFNNDEEGSVTLVEIDDTGDIILEENWTNF